MKITVSECIKGLVPGWFKEATRPYRQKLAALRYARRIVQHNYAGIPLQVIIADPLACSWYDCEWDEKPYWPLLRSNQLKTEATVFNLGAHQGVLAMMLSKIVGKTGNVIALEATEHNFKIATENLSLNKIENVNFLHAAVAETTGNIAFYDTFNGHIVTDDEIYQHHKVSSFSIDTLTNKFGRPDIITLDVEGYEVNVLRGATQTLALKPDWEIEVHANCGLETFGFKAEDLLEFFPQTDYKLYAYATDILELQPVENNFIFPNHNFHLIAIAR